MPASNNEYKSPWCKGPEFPNNDSMTLSSQHSSSSSFEDQSIPLPTNSNNYASSRGANSINKSKMKGRIGINSPSTARDTSISKSNFDCSEYSFERSQFVDGATSFDHPSSPTTMKDIMGNPAIFHKYQYPNLAFVLDTTSKLEIAHTTKEIAAPDIGHSSKSKIQRLLYLPLSLSNVRRNINSGSENSLQSVTAVIIKPTKSPDIPYSSKDTVLHDRRLCSSSTFKDYRQQNDPSLGRSSNYTVPNRQSLCSAPSPRCLSHQEVQHPHNVCSVSHNRDLLPQNRAPLILRPRLEDNPRTEPFSSSSSSSSLAGISTKKQRTSFSTPPTTAPSSKPDSKNTLNANCNREPPTRDVMNEWRLQEHFRNQNIRSKRTQSIILESHLDKIFTRFKNDHNESEIAMARQSPAFSSSPSFDVKLHPNPEPIVELKASDSRKKVQVIGFKSDLSTLDLEAALNGREVMFPLKRSRSHSAVICGANNKREKGVRGREYGKRCIEKLMRTWSNIKANVTGTSGSKAILSMWEGEADV